MRDIEHCKRMIELYKQAYQKYNMKQSNIDKAFKDRLEQERQLLLEEKIDKFQSKNKRVPNKDEIKEMKSLVNKTNITLTVEETLEVYEQLWEGTTYDDLYRPVDPIVIKKFIER